MIPDHDVLEAPGDVESEVLTKLEPWGGGVVADLMITLSPSQRRIAELRYSEDAELATIAAETGTSVPAVSQRLSTMHRKFELAMAA